MKNGGNIFYMIINNSWQNELPKIKSNSIDLIIIDPPYLTTNEKWTM